ncbi:hypothetical protein A2154_04960 [Candidatus Gottesmanbacteria bacterium RBG_16_43_7]|uniref:Type II secretion system protein GspG C-terminal domain-containing protein n=1 Tax=Candidatus Gottesmanbacteria bacterium RBG_16_43_7 TaxID=1798373 RepID=A0A1F5ZCU9_9BACT|nr:MAG: hypothetical protein A2154_04960 [Candidatus Gottesmanbacteria bacterium RBG_16_43_7]
MKHDTKNSGFTLIEVLVATTIIAVITAIGMVSYATSATRSRDAKRTADLEQIRAALEMYRTDIGTYPPDLPTLVTGNYLPAVPEPPKSTDPPYNLVLPTVYSYCLETNLENTGGSTSTCTCSSATYDYCLKNP